MAGSEITAASERAADLVAAALGRGGLSSAYQPIVDLRSGAVVAVEALARSPLAGPEELFAAARTCGRLAELDAACQQAAVIGARRAGLRAPLFVNVEPEAVHRRSLDALLRTAALAADGVPLVLEITERALTARPAELIDFLARARAAGWGIALDDVGSDPRSLALLPLVRPDVVKLDRALVQEDTSPASASVITAIAAACERSGALVLAEGIEDESHRRTALALGATLGQGWLFGAPAPLDGLLVSEWRAPRTPELQAVGDEATPFGVVSPERPTQRASWTLLLQISHLLETEAASLGSVGLIVSAFQSAERFTPLTSARYQALASTTAFTAALGVGMAAEPAPGVRGAALSPGHALAGEWSVVVMGPHFAGALVARERAEGHPRPDFDFAVTYERDLVTRAGTSLMRQVARAF